jgi:hypothetical protein
VRQDPHLPTKFGQDRDVAIRGGLEPMRAFMKAYGFKVRSDEDVERLMHRMRAHSPNVPKPMRAASRKWLTGHGDMVWG